MNTLLNGNLISTKEASQLSGYNADYLSRLCRTGKIHGEQIGRAWLIERSSLESFIAAQIERKIELSESLAHEREEEYRRANEAAVIMTPAMEKRTEQAVKSVIGLFSGMEMPHAYPVLTGRMAATALTAVLISGSVLVAGSGIPNRVGEAFASQAFEIRALALESADYALAFASEKRARLVLRANEEVLVRDMVLAQAGNGVLETLPSSVALRMEARGEETDVASLARVDGSLLVLEGSATAETIRLAFAEAAQNPASVVDASLRAYVGMGYAVRSDLAALGDAQLRATERAGEQLLAFGAGTRDLGSSAAHTYATHLYEYVGNADRIPRTIVGALYDLGDRTGNTVAYSLLKAPIGYDKGIAYLAGASQGVSDGIAGASFAFGSGARTVVASALTAQDRIIARSVQDASAVLAEANRGALAAFAVVPSAAALPASPLTALESGWSSRNVLDDAVAFVDSAVESFLALFASSDTELVVVPVEKAPEVAVAPTPTVVTGTTTVTYEGPVTVVRNEYPVVSYSGVSQEYVDAAIADINNRLIQNIDRTRRDASRNSGGSSGSGLVSIDGLTGTGLTLNTSTWNGGSINGATLDVLDTSITGDLFVQGSVTATDYIAGPYVLATSTTATSAFSGNISVGHNAIFGASAADTLTITSSINSNLTPSTTNTYDIGASGNEWRRGYFADVYVSGLANGCVEVVGGQLTSTGTNCGTGSGGITNLNGLTASGQTFATSSDTNIGLTITSSGSVHTFTPTWTGTLAAARGGTGLGSVVANQILIGNTGGTGWTQIATSSLGLPTFSDLGNYLSVSDWYATTTDALDEGSTNLYFTNTRADARIAAATSTIRGMFSASSPLSYNAGTGSFTLSMAGDWTGTFDGQEGSYYLARANHTGTQLASTISDFNTSVGSYITSSTTLASSVNYWTKTGSDLTYSGGNVGIGTSSPTALYGGKLAVSGPIYVGGASTTATSTFEGNVRVIGNLAVGSGTTWIRDNATSSFNGGVNVAGSINVTGAIMQNGVALSNPWTASGSDIYFNTGNLGIGTTSPDASLTINGNPVSGKLLSIVAPSYATSTTIVRTYTTNATWTKPANLVSVKVEVIGAGGGGSGGHERQYGYSGGAGAAGGNSVFSYNSGANVITGGGGGGGTGSVSTPVRGAAGTASGGDINISGSAGATSTGATGATGAAGVTTILDGYAGSGGNSNHSNSSGGAGGTGTGAGGGGGGTDGYSGTPRGGASGGSGGYASKTIAAGSIGASASITVGVGGGGGGGASYSADGNAASGGNGGGGASASGSSGGPGSGGSYSTSGVNRAGNGGSKGGTGTSGTGAAGGGGGSADIYGSYAGGGGGGGSGGLVIVTEYYEGPAQTFSALTVTTEGLVGIGTTSPKASLTIAGQLDSKNALLNVAGRRSSITRVYNKSGTWTKPAGLSYATIEVVGGGGGGAGSTVYYSNTTGYGGSGGAGSASQVVLAGGTVTGGGGGGGSSAGSGFGGQGGSGGTPANSFTGSSRSGASGNAVQGTIPGSGAHSVIDGATPTAGAGGGSSAGGIAGIGYGAGGGAGGYQSNGYPGGGGGSGAYVIATVPAASIGTTSTVTVGAGGGGGGGGAAMTGYPNTTYNAYNASGSSGGAGGNDASYSSGGTSYTTGSPGGGAGGVSAATVAGTAGSPGYGGGGGGGGAGYIAAGAHVSGYGGGGGAPGIVIITEYYDTPQVIDALNVTSTGNVGIGNASATYLLDVGTANLMGPVARFVNATGYCTINPTTAGISCSSDARLKKNISSISSTTDSLASIAALNPVFYNWNPESDAASKHSGFIAQEILKIFPDLVSLDDNGYYGVNYAGLTPYLAGAVQQLNLRTLFIEHAATDAAATTTYAGSLSVGGTLLLGSGTVSSLPESGLSIDTSALTVSGTLSAAAFDVPATALDFIIGSSTIQTILPSTVLSADGTRADLYRMAGYAISGVQELTRRTDLIAEKLESIEVRLAAVELHGAAGPGVIDLAASSVKGALASFGIMVENGLATFDKVIARQFAVSDDENGMSTAGSVTIPAGSTVAEVVNPYVLPTSKIFVSFTGPIQSLWYIDEKEEGRFTVVLANAQSNDVSFDYFILQTQGQLASPTAAGQHTAPVTPPPATPPVPEPFQPVFPGEGSGSSTPGSSDTTAPVVSLVGPAAEELTQGGSWSDSGATAMDETDGNLTASITVEGSVDTNTPGTYTVTYRVSDAAGNQGSVSRMVVVQAPVTAPEPPAEPPVAPAPEPITTI